MKATYERRTNMGNHITAVAEDGTVRIGVKSAATGNHPVLVLDYDDLTRIVDMATSAQEAEE